MLSRGYWTLIGGACLFGCGPSVPATSGGNGDGSSGPAGSTTAAPGSSSSSSSSSGDVDPESTGGLGSSSSTGEPPDEVLQDCDAERYRLGDPSARAHHLIIVDELETAEFDVRWRIAGGGVLVLSSYDPVRWRVTLQGDGSLDRVVVNGLGRSTVDVPDGVDVETIEDPTLWFERYPSVDGERARHRLGILSELAVTGMDTCREGATEAILTADNALDGPWPPPAVEPKACESIRFEPSYCLLNQMMTGRYTLIGLNSRTTCTVNEAEAWMSESDGGWATTNGRTVYFCSRSPQDLGQHTVAVGDLLSGRVEWTDIACTDVRSSSRGAYMLRAPSDLLTVYDDVDRMLAGMPEASYPIGPGEFAALDDLFFGTAPNDTVEQRDLFSGELLASFPLSLVRPSADMAAADGALITRSSDGTFRFHVPDTGDVPSILETDLGWPGRLICVDQPPI